MIGLYVLIVVLPLNTLFLPYNLGNRLFDKEWYAYRALCMRYPATIVHDESLYKQYLSRQKSLIKAAKATNAPLKRENKQIDAINADIAINNETYYNLQWILALHARRFITNKSAQHLRDTEVRQLEYPLQEINLITAQEYNTYCNLGNTPDRDLAAAHLRCSNFLRAQVEFVAGEFMTQELLVSLRTSYQQEWLTLSQEAKLQKIYARNKEPRVQHLKKLWQDKCQNTRPSEQESDKKSEQDNKQSNQNACLTLGDKNPSEQWQKEIQEITDEFAKRFAKSVLSNSAFHPIPQIPRHPLQETRKSYITPKGYTWRSSDCAPLVGYDFNNSERLGRKCDELYFDPREQDLAQVQSSKEADSKEALESRGIIVATKPRFGYQKRVFYYFPLLKGFGSSSITTQGRTLICPSRLNPFKGIDYRPYAP